MRRNFFLSLIIVLCMIFASCSGKQKDVMNMDYLIEDVTLNSGYTMPMLGLGTWTLKGDVAEESVYHALQVGYRLIDTAKYYGNEVEVGRGIRRAVADGLVTRGEIFVTSKIVPYSHNDYDAAIKDSLNALDIDYIDLMLVHQPGYGDEQLYKALERGVKSGKIRSIGISNYYTPADFDRIRNIAEIVPAVIQNENHPFYQNKTLQEYAKQFGTVIESWYPLGGRGNTGKILGNKVIVDIAKRMNKTPAQVVIRWHLQSGYIAIPGSGNINHIAENFNVFDFVLTPEEMNRIDELNNNQRFEIW